MILAIKKTRIRMRARIMVGLVLGLFVAGWARGDARAADLQALPSAAQDEFDRGMSAAA